MSTINDLSTVSTVSSADKLPLWSNANGVTRGLPISVLDDRYITQDDIAELAASTTVETFVAGVDFTPGSTLALTLANQYYSAQNIEVFFDAAFQGPDQYSLVGFGLAFISAIPVGVQNVYVRGGAARLIGAPSDGTVTASKLAPGAVTAVAMGPSAVGDPAINWSGILARDAVSVAAMQALSTTRYSHCKTLGFYAAGDGGQDEYFSIASGGTLGWSDITANDGGIWRRVFKGKINARQYGLKGDGNMIGGGTDDTALMQALVNGAPQYSEVSFTYGCYNTVATNFGTGVFDRTFRCEHAVIFGIATTATDSIINIAGASNCKFIDMAVTSDGILAAPVHALNYGAAIHMTCGVGFNSCFLWFTRPDIRNMKAGIVNGSFIGNAAQANGEASEIWIDGANFRGILQPLYCNAQSGYMVVSNSCINAQQMEAGAWWNPNQGFCVRNEALPTGQGNHIILQGCEFQRADTLVGNWIYGGNIVIDGMVFEVANPAFVTGDVSVSGDIDGFFGPGSTPVFQIAPGSTGRLLLDNFRCDRPPGTANGDLAHLVEGTGSINYRVVMRDCHLREWFYTANNGAAQIVKGCQFDYDRLTIDNSTTTSWYLDADKGNKINNADLSSHAISTSGGTTAQGGWICPGTNAGNAYQQLATDSPYSSDTSCFQVVTTAAGFVLQTQTATRFNVEGGRVYTLEMPVKDGGSGAGGFISLGLSFYDFAGNLLAPGTAGQLNQSSMTSAGYANWNMLRGPVVAPVNACTAAFVLNFGINSTVRFYHPKVK